MDCPTEIRTERLLLRRWRESDLAPFAAMNADPEVMRYFPRMLTRTESDSLVARIEDHFERNGFGLWAVEVVGGEPFIGFVGLLRVGFDAPFAPAVEVGWRLARNAWGLGYATEGARASLEYAFGCLGLKEVVSFTATGNTRSRRVMERLGMVRDELGDFEHPALEPGDPLRLHVLYRADSGTWPIAPVAPPVG